MATPRGGSKFFRAMGQSAASRGFDVCAVLLDEAGDTAIEAWVNGYFDQRGQIRIIPLFEDKVTTRRSA